MTEMAISNYLGVLIVLFLAYPFALVAVQMFCYADVVKKKYTKYLNIVVGLAFVFLLIMHLQTEVIYGKELLDSLSNK
ncbi:hypothetical protein L4C38_10195 [Vibrio kasasachensis]|uniref:hypothetical protein n=1 Tax=Vibrio kasasachensis TaxID=2910248 RepID=UPI003D0CEBA2